MPIDGNAGSLTENLIALIEAAGGDRPASKGLQELYQALAVALSAFSPGGGGGIAPVLLVSAFSDEITTSPPSGPATIDGTVVNTGDRIWLNAQTPDDNGIWLANTSGLWTRPSDWASGSVIPNGTLFSVSSNGSFLFSSVWITQQDVTVDLTGVGAQCLAAVEGIITTPAEGLNPIVAFFASAVNFDTTNIGMGGLPTSDPGNSGQLWNDAGTVKVSP